MSFTKPTDLPEFATDDLVDPTSGDNNVIEPATNDKKWGWYPYKRKPNRGVMNWLARLTYLWLGWLEQELSPLIPVIATVPVNLKFTTDGTGGGTTLATASLIVRKTGKLVSVFLETEQTEISISKAEASGSIGFFPQVGSAWPTWLQHDCIDSYNRVPIGAAFNRGTVSPTNVSQSAVLYFSVTNQCFLMTPLAYLYSGDTWTQFGTRGFTAIFYVSNEA